MKNKLQTIHNFGDIKHFYGLILVSFKTEIQVPIYAVRTHKYIYV